MKRNQGRERKKRAGGKAPSSVTGMEAGLSKHPPPDQPLAELVQGAAREMRQLYATQVLEALGRVGETQRNDGFVNAESGSGACREEDVPPASQLEGQHLPGQNTRMEGPLFSSVL